MITTNDDAIADRLRVLRNQGMRERYEYEMAGHNYRLTDLQAALAIPQLAAYGDTWPAAGPTPPRSTRAWPTSRACVTPSELPGREHVWHQYTVLTRRRGPSRPRRLHHAS